MAQSAPTAFYEPKLQHEMKYFIAHLLSGDAKTYHERVTRELSARFRIVPLHERVPPHLTIKIPFEATDEQIKDVEKVLRSFARMHRPHPFSMKGFGHFGFRTIYMDVPKGDVVFTARKCLATLRTNAPWLPPAPLEGNKLHASVARFLSRRQFKRIWRVLTVANEPCFETSFDNISILRKDDSRWVVASRIAFGHEHFPEQSSETRKTLNSKALIS